MHLLLRTVYLWACKERNALASSFGARLCRLLLVSLAVCLLACSSSGNVYALKGSMMRIWMGGGAHVLGPTPITGRLSSDGHTLIVLDRVRPAPEPLFYSSDGVDNMVVAVKRDNLAKILALEAHSVSGFGVMQAGSFPKATEELVYTADLQLLVLALDYWRWRSTESLRSNLVGKSEIILANPLLPESGLPLDDATISVSPDAQGRVNVTVDVRYPGQGKHRRDNYQYRYPGPFATNGYVGLTFRIAGLSPEPFCPSHFTVSVTNYLPVQSAADAASPYDTLGIHEVFVLDCSVDALDDGENLLALANSMFNRIVVNDYRMSEDPGAAREAIGLELGRTNVWPVRTSKEFRQVRQDYEQRVGGRKRFWTILPIVLGALLLPAVVLMLKRRN